MPGRARQFWEGDGGVPDGSESPKESQFKVPPEPEITLEEDEVPVALRVTDFKPLIADPYRFVLERVYRLDSIDDCARELNPLAFGTLAHDILHQFGLLALTSPPEVDVCDELDIARVLKDLLIAEVSTRFGEGALPAVHIQAEQLQARMRAFATKQAEWAAEGWRIVAVECEAAGEGVPFDVDDTPILLRGRIDRIDHNPKTGEWAVLDYKTSNSVDPPEKSHRKKKTKKELAEELGISNFAALSRQDLVDRIQEAGGDDGHWTDLQLPLYRQLLSGIVDEQGRQLVSDETDKILLGYVYLPKNLDKGEFVVADWSKKKLEFAEEAARDAVRRLRKRIFKFDANVTKPSRFGRDALKPLLTKGWQVTREDEGAPSEDGSSEKESGQ